MKRFRYFVNELKLKVKRELQGKHPTPIVLLDNASAHKQLVSINALK